MKGRDVVSTKDLTKEEILAILAEAKKIKTSPPGPLLRGRLLGSCFFEPSTRTRLSFEAAMKRLGGEVVGFTDPQSSSLQKGESLYDTIRVVGGFVDCIVLRHPLEGAAREAAEATNKPIINAGDGANEHPTQTLLDLFTIEECQGRLEELNIAFVGDLKFGRTVHSLAYALAHFNCRLFFVAPPMLELPSYLYEVLRHAGVLFSSHATIEEVINHVDILYMTRVQKERFLENFASKQLILTPEMLFHAKKGMKVLHPLPRIEEIAREVDKLDCAHYFVQAENGLYVRQALLKMILG